MCLNLKADPKVQSRIPCATVNSSGYKTRKTDGSYSPRQHLSLPLATMSPPLLLSSSAAVVARKMSTGSTSSAADKRTEILRALRAENTVFKTSPYGFDSALETEANASASSLDLSTIAPASLERIRRRSELSRISQVIGETIELPVLSPIEERTNAQSGAVAPGSQLSLSKVTDIEVAPAPYAASVESSAAPAFTPAQRAVFRRNARLQFFALCYSFFLEGWNDGSTGPLLPRIERNYHVSPPSQLIHHHRRGATDVCRVVFSDWLRDRVYALRDELCGTLPAAASCQYGTLTRVQRDS